MIDLDKGGMITKVELANAVKKTKEVAEYLNLAGVDVESTKGRLAIEKFFRSVDTQGLGEIGFRDFCKFKPAGS